MTDETSNVNEPEIDDLSGQQIGDSLMNINKCLELLSERVQEIEKYVSELPTPAKTYYKPEGYDDYMNLAENFTEIYKKLNKIESEYLERLD